MNKLDDVKLKEINITDLMDLKDHKGFKQFILGVEDALNGAHMGLRAEDELIKIYRTQGEIYGYEIVSELLEVLIEHAQQLIEEKLTGKDKPNGS